MPGTVFQNNTRVNDNPGPSFTPVPGESGFPYSDAWDNFANGAPIVSSEISTFSVEAYRFGAGPQIPLIARQPSDESMVSSPSSSDETGLSSLPSLEGVGSVPSNSSINSTNSSMMSSPLVHKKSPSRNKHFLRLPHTVINTPIPPSLLDPTRRTSLPVSAGNSLTTNFSLVVNRSASVSSPQSGGQSPLGQHDTALATDDEDGEFSSSGPKGTRPSPKPMVRKGSKGGWPYDKAPSSAGYGHNLGSYSGPSPLSTSTSATSYFPPQTKSAYPAYKNAEGYGFDPSAQSTNQSHTPLVGISKFASYQQLASAQAASINAPPEQNLLALPRGVKSQSSSLAPPPLSIPAANSGPITHLLLDGHDLNSLFESRYDLSAVLGSGGYGFVCVAVDKRRNKEVAVKFILSSKVPAHAWVEWTCQGEAGDGMPPLGGKVPMECELLRRIRHQGVVRGEGVYADEKFFYLVQELHGASWCPSTPATPLTPSTPSTPASPHITAANLAAVSSTLSLDSTRLTSPVPFAPSYPLPASPACGPPSLITNSTPPPLSGLESRRPSLNMERRGSCDLFECVEANKRFNEPKARGIFFQVVETVYALSKEGIYHRDIKDENIVVDRKLKVKLIDFGSAVWERGPEPVRYKDFFGTNAYASPEILERKTYLASQAEVWSLGILLCILITGESPFSSSSNAMVGRRSPLRNGVVMSKELVDLIDRCLQVDPEKRINLEQMRGHKWFRS